jgi:hypothetical protein
MAGTTKSFLISLHSLLYYDHRYIDDVLFTWNGSLSSLQTHLYNLNHKHKNIKLVSEIGLSVSFLDVFIQIENGILFTSVYHKDAAEPYVVPFASDHPPHIFQNIINGALDRAIRYSSTFEAFNDERRQLRLKLQYNGYIFISQNINVELQYRQNFSFYRYPSRYIDIHIRKYFAKHNVISSSSALLSTIDTSYKFFDLRNRLLNKLITQKTHDANNHPGIVIDKNRPTHVTVKKSSYYSCTLRK